MTRKTEEKNLGGKASKVARLDDIRKRVAERRAEESDSYSTPSDTGGGGVTHEFVLDCLRANELGDGLLFCALLRGKYLYDKTSCRWMRWNGHHWKHDIMDQAAADVERVVERYIETARDHVEGRKAEAYADGDTGEAKKWERLQKDLYGRVQQLRTDRRRRTCLTFAHTCHDPLSIQGDDMDRNPWLIACSTGVIDLRKGELRDGRPDDLVSKASPVEWRGLDAQRETWDRALLEIFSGDADLVAYVQRLFGYAITGLTTDHVLPVLWGQGRNGKSMMVEAITSVMGELAAPIQSEMLLDQGKTRSSAGPSPDIMSLFGLRLAFASETDEGRRISPARVKWLTGGDVLVGRRPNDKLETRFKSTHTLFLMTNHRPGAPGDDFAFWERIHLIPFLLSFVDREPRAENERRADKSLPEKLRAEAPGILAWLVEGCLLWQRDGLKPPAAVEAATSEYHREEDVLADFIDECCLIPEPDDPHDDFSVGASELYAEFERWFEKSVSKKVPKQRRFGTWMSRRFRKEKTGGVYVYFGIRLRA